MKYFLMIFIFALSLKADTIYDAKCVSSFFVSNTTMGVKTIRITFSDISKPITTITYDQNILDSLVSNMDKFYYPQQGFNTCNLIPKNNTLGLTNEQYNLMMALTGLLSSILLVSIIFKKV